MGESTLKTSSLMGPIRLFLVRVVAALLLINLFVAGLAGFHLYRSRQEQENKIATQTQNLAQSLSLTLSGILDKSSVGLFAVKTEAERQLHRGPIDHTSFQAYVLAVREQVPELDGLRVTDAQGTILYGDHVVPEARVSFADRDVFIKSKGNPAPV
ncbi:PDC sensor domain-containing protein [Geomesophilobacter sediminis]|uniref:Uncharacterized protein n=1 Tax=Geomesophilobacter sediminis TaxID=2798584 RepID=A0A8J7M1B3_9BACT|nr:hypothetical protein [Geomesophilobacter sediminis]MBJ6726860.1 hypothetical protein [Geomesophilobacter sediminis]